jgi:hypothetical protein
VIFGGSNSNPIGGKETDRIFREKVLRFGLLRPLKEKFQAGRHRLAQLFRFEALRTTSEERV